MANAGFDGEVFVNRSLQVVITGYVRAQRRPIRGNGVVRLDLGSAAAIVELESGIDVAIRTVGVNLASCRLTVAHDRVTKRLQGDGIGCRQQRDCKNENGERCETKHATRLCH